MIMPGASGSCRLCCLYKICDFHQIDPKVPFCIPLSGSILIFLYHSPQAMSPAANSLSANYAFSCKAFLLQKIPKKSLCNKKNSCPLCFIRKGRSKSCGTTFFHRRLASSVSVSISVSSSPDEQNIILRYDNVYLLRHSLLDLFGVKLQEVFITNGPCASHHPAAFCLNVMSVITYSFHR